MRRSYGGSAGAALFERAVGHGRAGPLQLQAGEGHALAADGPGAGIEALGPAVAPVDQSQLSGHDRSIPGTCDSYDWLGDLAWLTLPSCSGITRSRRCARRSRRNSSGSTSPTISTRTPP